MYFRLKMMDKWSDFLVFLGEIRKALAVGDEERVRAFNRPPTISDVEFAEFQRDDLSDERFNELSQKWIDYHDGPFYECNQSGWSVPVGLNSTLSYDSNEYTLTLTWDHSQEYACRIIPLLFRLALILAFNEMVSYSYPLVTRLKSVNRDKDRKDDVLLEDVTFQTDPAIEARGDFISFALLVASLYRDVDRLGMYIPQEHQVYRV